MIRKRAENSGLNLNLDLDFVDLYKVADRIYKSLSETKNMDLSSLDYKSLLSMNLSLAVANAIDFFSTRSMDENFSCTYIDRGKENEIFVLAHEIPLIFGACIQNIESIVTDIILEELDATLEKTNKISEKWLTDKQFVDMKPIRIRQVKSVIEAMGWHFNHNIKQDLDPV